MRNKTRLVQGVGINDANYRVMIKNTKKGVTELIWSCPYHTVWSGMLKRCYSDKYKAKYPTYNGCTVDKAWLSFMCFRSWMVTQPWEGNQLDKDLLVEGNKIYSAELCVFVSNSLNSFTVGRDAGRGDCPIGVYWNKSTGMFQPECKNPFTRKSEYLGRFDCAKEAHEAWRIKKHEHACRYADMQDDQRIAEALRRRYSKDG